MKKSFTSLSIDRILSISTAFSKTILPITVSLYHSPHLSTSPALTKLRMCGLIVYLGTFKDLARLEIPAGFFSFSSIFNFRGVVLKLVRCLKSMLIAVSPLGLQVLLKRQTWLFSVGYTTIDYSTPSIMATGCVQSSQV